MDDKRTGAVWIVAAIMVLLPLLYVGSYLALVQAEPLGVGTYRGPWQKPDTYRFGGTIAKHFFYPANVIDRRIRPAYWEVDIRW